MVRYFQFLHDTVNTVTTVNTANTVNTVNTVITVNTSFTSASSGRLSGIFKLELMIFFSPDDDLFTLLPEVLELRKERIWLQRANNQHAICLCKTLCILICVLSSIKCIYFLISNLEQSMTQTRWVGGEVNRYLVHFTISIIWDTDLFDPQFRSMHLLGRFTSSAHSKIMPISL